MSSATPPTPIPGAWWRLLALLWLTAAAPITVTVPQLDDPRTLSPDFVADPGAYQPTSNIYSHLVAMDWSIASGGAVYGDLAKSWEFSDDAKTITFHLHDGVTWQDGEKLTAADIQFTFSTIIAKNYPLAAFLRNVQDISTPDDTTLVIRLRGPDMSFVPMLAQAAVWYGKIYPKHLWASQPGFDTGPYVNHPIGSGPFTFERWQNGTVELAANPAYFRGRPRIDRLVIRHVPDLDAARAGFDAGEFSLLPFDFAPPWAEVPSLQSDPSVQVVFTPSIYSRDIQINLRHAPLSDPRVRRALALAVDRDEISRLAFNSVWKPAYHADLDGQTAWLNPSATFPHPDRTAAAALLDQAGLPKHPDGWRFALKITGPPAPDCQAINQVLVEQFRSIGIDATLDQFDRATWFQRLQQGSFDISCYFTRYGPDPDAFREHFATNGPRNFMGYSNPTLDSLTARAVTLTDQAARRALYDQVQDILVHDMPYIDLVNEVKVSLEKPGWSGFPYDQAGWGKSITWFGYFPVEPPK